MKIDKLLSAVIHLLHPYRFGGLPFLSSCYLLFNFSIVSLAIYLLQWERYYNSLC